MKEIEISHGAWKITVHVRLSLDDPTQWAGSYHAEAPGHLPHTGNTANYDHSDRALDRAIGDALRDIVQTPYGEVMQADAS
jgi:hypothetical protein